MSTDAQRMEALEHALMLSKLTPGARVEEQRVRTRRVADKNCITSLVLVSFAAVSSPMT